MLRNRMSYFSGNVTGVKKHNLRYFAVGRLKLKNMVLCVILRIRLKLKDFGGYAKEKMMPEI